MQEFKLPSLGADMDEGTLVQWKIQPGDRVKRGDIVAVVDTSKAAIDVECWQDGTVQQLCVQPGDKFPVGTVMARLDGAGTAATPDGQAAADSLRAVPSVKPVAPAKTMAAKARPAPAAPIPATAARELQREPSQAASSARRRISPVARKRAAELGIDLATLQGSGPDGSITLADVETPTAAVPTPATSPPAAARDRGAAMRKTIAAAMSRSKREIPHYYLAETIVLARAQHWLAEWNAARPITERVLLSALLLKAVAHALRKYPRLNGFYRNEEFEPAPAVHVGVAISLRSGGLVAPALLDVHSKPLPALMLALNDLVQRTRAGSLRSSELSSATITVTNLGEQSVEDVFGVIYPPQVAIIGFGGVHQQLLAGDDGIRTLPVLRASLAADHRVSDGHYGARFLQQLAAQLQDPDSLVQEAQA